MIKIWLTVLLSSLLLFGESNSIQASDATPHNSVVNPEGNTSAQQAEKAETESMKELLLQRINQLDEELKKDNIWSKIYSNYRTYLLLKEENSLLDAKIETLENKYKLNKEQKAELKQYQIKKETIIGKLQLLEEYEKDPFGKMVLPEHIDTVPSVGNPLAIIGAISFQKKLLSQADEYNARYESLTQIIEKIKEEEKILQELIALDKENSEYRLKLKNIKDQLKTLAQVSDIFETTQGIYTKKIDEIKIKLRTDIENEVLKGATIGGAILFLLFLLFLGKYLVRKYMPSDNNRFYTINKFLNFTFITIAVLILLFGYIENVSYLVTVLGFASAGIAIAMKDWFMSLMGWFVIMIGGAVHVGDRVKLIRNGVEFVGDIVDISPLRITMHEDVTLTTYMVNKRAGRMIFIPNNYIFTEMIANYTHDGLKTVWDGIDFTVTFDSNIHKTVSIAKEISKKYSKGYADITRKQLNRLRNQYSIRNTGVDPRIFTFIEPYGMKISVWYLTNSYATMALRSSISIEIIERIQAESDISLAFPTQSVYLDKGVPKPPFVPMQSSDEETDKVYLA
jgi:small-conductance mechanosensitive channel